MTNIELIRTYYSLFNEKRYDEMAELLDEKIVHFINEGSTEEGCEKFRSFLNTMDVHYDEQIEDLELFIGESADRIAAEFYIVGIYKKTAEGLPQARNQKYKVPVGAFFEIKNKKIFRITNYYNLKEWVEQVSQW
ncbi:MAG: nuclear transport factor 2 family protein [Oligoflexia bacterium]|nr:nuclear transport factor 2 family protein [Oligoflexia bacterium]